MHKIIRSIVLAVLVLTSGGVAQNAGEQEIDKLFQELKLTLVNRSRPENLLSPLRSESKRQKGAQKALRPYLTVQFKSNVADLERTGPNDAQLPLTVEWETARASGGFQDSAHLVKVGDRWYLRDFDFMTFPWVLLWVVCSFSVALVGIVLYFRAGRVRRRIVPG
jgi:hypothetical protein